MFFFLVSLATVRQIQLVGQDPPGQLTIQERLKSEASPGCCCSQVGGSAVGKPAAAAGPHHAGSAGIEGRVAAALAACGWCPV